MPTPQSAELVGFEGANLDERFPQQVDETQAGEEETPASETPSEPEKKPAEGSEEPHEESSQDEPAPEEQSEQDEREPAVPLSRFQKVYNQVKELRAKIATIEQSPAQLTDDDRYQLEEDKKLEQRLNTILAKRESERSKQDESTAEELVELMEVYGDFDVDKVLNVKDEYNISDNLAAVKLYFKLYGQGSAPRTKGAPAKAGAKPKVPTPSSSGPATVPAKKLDFQSSTLANLVEEGLKEHGITR